MILLLLMVIICLLLASTGILAYLAVLIKEFIKPTAPEHTEKKRQIQHNGDKSPEERFFENFLSYDGDPQPEFRE